MNKHKKQPTLTGRVVLAWMLVLILVSVAIGAVCSRLYIKQLLDARADEALNVAVSTAMRIDGDKFAEIIDTMEKNDYWYEIKDYVDRTSKVFGTAYLYVLDKHYDDEVTYFAEGTVSDDPFDLGVTEETGIYHKKMFTTIATGESSFTGPYPSGDYGEMVSGFAAIKNAAGQVVGVVGADFYYEDTQAKISAFILSIAGVVLSFCVSCFFIISHLGNKLVGKPLAQLDQAARRLSYGDMDVDLDIRSTSEIGRLAESMDRMIAGMKEQIFALEDISRGDLTVTIEPRGDKDTMGHAIVQILDNLNHMLDDINRSTTQVSTGAKHLAAGAQTLAQGATEQASAVEQLSVSINDVAEKTSQNAAMAGRAASLGNIIKDNAEKGSRQMDQMMQAVQEINEASHGINKVIKVIDDIAFQTNILALNAAVEAARAGHHGKGFAAVAEEVRNLAAKSAAAAKDTGALIVNSMEKAGLGAQIAEETAQSLAEIVAGINESSHIVSDIAKLSQEQAGAISQINKGIDQVAQVVQQNSATAEQSAAASQQMSEESAVLRDLVERFKIADNTLYLE